MVRDANGRNDSIRAKYVGRWLHSGSRELQIFNARKPLYAFDKDFTLDSERKESLQIYYVGIVYFFRYIKISSALKNNCAYTLDSFACSGGRGCFQLC